MGIFIYMSVSKSVTPKEWLDVYQETLKLVRAFPLAELREVPIRGIPTTCWVPSEERETHRGWNRDKTITGWFAEGDYEYLRTAECYFLPRDLVAECQYEEGASDAILGSYDWVGDRDDRCYSLWDAKTQGEPYHMYLLAIACLIESRLGRKAYVYGDITRGQCERAVRMANEHLDMKIHTPDRCDRDRLLARIDDLPLGEAKKLQQFVRVYLGKQDAEFGTSIRNHFSEQACNEYWEKRFRQYSVSMWGFDSVLKDYLLWGFDLQKMCSFVRFEDDEGTAHYEDFVGKVMDAKLHHREKDCVDVLELDPDEEEPYGISTLFAQFVLGGARNKKVDRYIPIEEIKSALSHAIGHLCQVDALIDGYLQRESAQKMPDLLGELIEEDLQRAIEQDPSYVLNEAIRSKENALRDASKKFDITCLEDLQYYETGDSISPDLTDTIGEYFAFYREITNEDTYSKLMKGTPEERCRWLPRKNRNILLRDKDWEKVYDDILNHPESFERYYPMVRVVANNKNVQYLVRALVVNDALYTLALELGADRRKR